MNVTRRRLNWDDEEKNLFRLVLKDYVKFIENKATNSSANNLKNKAWEAVHRRFNQLNRRQRLLYQLKTQWKRMKLSARRRHNSTIKKEIHETDEARPKALNDEVVKDLLSSAKPSGDQNRYDSDGIDSEPITYLITLDEEITQTNEEIADEEIASSTKKVSVNKRKISDHIGEKYLKHNKEDCIASSNTTEHSILLKDEEHRRRIEMAEEEHVIKMGILKEQLKSATLEREILELKKKREQNFFSDYVC